MLTIDAAFISSVSSTSQLCLGFMGRHEDGEHGVFDSTAFEPELAAAVGRYNAAVPDGAAEYVADSLPHGLKQDALSAPLYEAEYAAFETSFLHLPEAERRIHYARLRSCRSLESGAFLLAPPNEHMKTKMPDTYFRSVAVEQRLGILHVEGRLCAFGCGEILDACGAHAASCKHSGMAKVRHDHLKETLGHATHAAGMMVQYEPPDLIAHNGRLKPADVSVSGLVPGRLFTSIDVTVVNPACTTHVANGQIRGQVAQLAENKKRLKYLRVHRVVPFAVETYGTFGRSAKWVCRKIVNNYTSVHPDIDRFAERVQSTYILQVLSVALQCGNAQVILACGDPMMENRLLNSVDVYAPLVLPNEMLRIEHN